MKTRFCPSPTGFIHLGNAKTALFNALLAGSKQATFLLRIEDTDQSRSDVKYVDALKKDLQWLGITWQEGPEKDGGNGPYFQSQRQAIYDKYYDFLIEKKIAYPCFCSQQELKLSRKKQLAAGQPPRYSGKCYHLSQAEIDAKINSGEKPVLRFHVPTCETISFVDLVKGKQQFECEHIGDFIIRRQDGTSPFMFCNAIDDSLMGVTHLLRGEDHLSNTPYQLLILKTLGLRAPDYGHLSLIVGCKGAKLSKRCSDESLRGFRENGIMAQALLNYMARLGHHYDHNRVLNFDELSREFDLSHLSKSPVQFDEDQLHFWQKSAIAVSDTETLWKWMGESTHRIVPEEKRELFVNTVAPNILSPDDAIFWARIIFQGIQTKVEIDTDKTYFENAIEILHQTGNDYSNFMAQLKIATNLKGKSLFMPLRLALTGEEHGPELAQLFQLMDTTEIEKRFKNAL